jgi:hypothetical protein
LLFDSLSSSLAPSNRSHGDCRGGRRLTVFLDPLKTRSAPSTFSLFGWLVADDWCWFVLREEYCWLVAAGCWWLVRSERKVLLAGG